MKRLTAVTLVSAALLSCSALAQYQPSTNDPRALALASQTIAALTHGSAIRDVRLTANVRWIAGLDRQAGRGVLQAKGTSESRIDIALSSGGKRTEIRNAFNGPAGKWVNPDGKSGKYAFHNCLSDAAWFFPAFSSLARMTDSHFVFSYVGEETWNGLSAVHLHISQPQEGFHGAFPLGTMDYYLDSDFAAPARPFLQDPPGQQHAC